jgi:hypothetical protein
MSQLIVVVIGANDAARIATKRAREVNPEARIVTIDPADSDTLSLDMDARAVLVTTNDITKRVRFDSLVYSDITGDADPIVEKSPRFLPEFSFEVAKQALAALNAGGLDLHTWQNQRARLPPSTDLLADAGAIIAKDATVFVDEHMCTSLDGVYACGNAVSLLKAISNNRLGCPSPSMMERAAQVAGTNAARNQNIETLQPCAGSEIIHVGDTCFGRTGLSNTELHQFYSQNEFARSTLMVDEKTVRLLAARDTGAIIGGELVGTSDFVAQLHLISMCVVKGLKADDLIDLDVDSSLRQTAEHLRSELSRDTQSISGENLALWMAEGRTFQCLDVGATPSPISRYMSATHVPLKDLKKRLSDLTTHQPLVVSSPSGRSAVAAFRLLKKKLGTESLFHLEGGSNAMELLMGDPPSVKH